MVLVTCMFVMFYFIFIFSYIFLQKAKNARLKKGQLANIL